MKNTKFFAAVLTAAAAGLLLVGCSSGKSGKTITIDLEDYISVTTSGYDGKGTASLSFNKVKLINDYTDDIDYSSSLKSDAKKITDKERADFILNDDTISLENLTVIASLKDADATKVTNASDDPDAKYFSGLIAADIEYYNEFSAADMLSKFLSCSINRTEELSNGDVITVKLDRSDYLEDCFNIKFENNAVEYTVSNLSEVEAIDPFEYIEVSFSGTAPKGEASVTKTTDDEITSLIGYSIEPASNLSNGDTIKITAEDKGLETVGKVLSSTEKEWTVDGLNHYINSLSEISEDIFNKLDEQSVKAINSMSSVLDILDCDYCGSFFSDKIK